MKHTDQLITDYENKNFQAAFRVYFDELGIQIKNWDTLFAQMTNEADPAILREDEDGCVIGFIQFSAMTMKSWFFEAEYGFIREFWIAPEYRRQGHGTELLNMAEEWFQEQGIRRMILTTDTAEKFYMRHGYHKEVGISAKNNDPVYVKKMECMEWT